MNIKYMMELVPVEIKITQELIKYTMNIFNKNKVDAIILLEDVMCYLTDLKKTYETHDDLYDHFIKSLSYWANQQQLKGSEWKSYVDIKYCKNLNEDEILAMKLFKYPSLINELNTID